MRWSLPHKGTTYYNPMSTTDYACGIGADCEEIRPQGRCYHPDTEVPHASYAFSDYWQMKKRIGATCDFEDRNDHRLDLSFPHCTFINFS
ncbi:hypothetical protein Sjap_022278 [Stephania japonica]|uniref:X8 domain-containing protein n=1 Tax=Stephania japonica TaxID=461633 RepID=A0AAP0HUA5_9MAGN